MAVVGNARIAHNDLVKRGVKMDEVRDAAPGVWVSDGKDPEGNPFSIESHQ